MKGVDISKACGYDGVGNKIIKLCSEGFHVIPLFENDNRQLKVNYHPVSLLASFSKICERVVFFYLYNFLMEVGFLYKF